METSRIVPSHVSEDQRATFSAFFQRQMSDFNKQIVPVLGRSSRGLGPIASMEGRNESSSVSPDQYTVAIVCAMMDEANPVQALFDDDQPIQPCRGPDHDHNIYIVGRFAGHHTVLVTPGEIGELDTGLCAQRLRTLFRNVELTLLIGVCGAVYKTHHTKEDIYLGDVIVGDRVWRYLHNAHSSQHGQGVKLELRNLQTENTSERVKQLGNQCQSIIFQDRILELCVDHLESLTSRYPRYAYPGCGMDNLFEPSYVHQDGSTCECTRQSGTIYSSAKSTSSECLDSVFKRRRSSDENPPRPKVHVGTIASADVVMRASDTFAQRFADNNVLGIDMEGGGVSKATDCMVIKSAVDYADTHKNKNFRLYGAATAASFAKAALEVLFQRNEDKAGPETRYLQSRIFDDFKIANEEFSKALRSQGQKALRPVTTYESFCESTHSIQNAQSFTNTLRGLEIIQPLVEGIETYIQTTTSLLNLDFDIDSYLWVRHVETCGSYI
jgi:nucleoside phosphorylase